MKLNRRALARSESRVEQILTTYENQSKDGADIIMNLREANQRWSRYHYGLHTASIQTKLHPPVVEQVKLCCMMMQRKGELRVCRQSFVSGLGAVVPNVAYLVLIC